MRDLKSDGAEVGPGYPPQPAILSALHITREATWCRFASTPRKIPCLRHGCLQVRLRRGMPAPELGRCPFFATLAPEPAQAYRGCHEIQAAQERPARRGFGEETSVVDESRTAQRGRPDGGSRPLVEAQARVKRRVVHSCSEGCGRLVSAKRKRCPHCGVKFETKRRTMYNTRKAYWTRQEKSA